MFFGERERLNAGVWSNERALLKGRLISVPWFWMSAIEDRGRGHSAYITHVRCTLCNELCHVCGYWEKHMTRSIKPP
jgi:hypothetical protein